MRRISVSLLVNASPPVGSYLNVVIPLAAVCTVTVYARQLIITLGRCEMSERSRLIAPLIDEYTAGGGDERKIKRQDAG